MCMGVPQSATDRHSVVSQPIDITRESRVTLSHSEAEHYAACLDVKVLRVLSVHPTFLMLQPPKFRIRFV